MILTYLFSQLNSRVFRDMIGTENKLHDGENVPFITHAKHLLKERMPTVYGSPPRAVVQENEVENLPESNPSSKTIQIDTSTSDKSQNLSVVKSKRVAQSDKVSKSSGLRSSLHLKKQKQGKNRAATTLPQTQTNIKKESMLLLTQDQIQTMLLCMSNFPT